MKEYGYAELVCRLRAETQSGVYLAGQQLPSENELAAMTGHSRQAARQATGVSK